MKLRRFFLKTHPNKPLLILSSPMHSKKYKSSHSSLKSREIVDLSNHSREFMEYNLAHYKFLSFYGNVISLHQYIAIHRFTVLVCLNILLQKHFYSH